MLHIRFHVEKHRLVKYLTTRTETNIKPYHTDHAKSNPNHLIANPQTHYIYSAPAITVGTQPLTCTLMQRPHLLVVYICTYQLYCSQCPNMVSILYWILCIATASLY